jgi:hypothetical protein
MIPILKSSNKSMNYKQLKVPDEEVKETLWSKFSMWWHDKTRYTWWGRMDRKWHDFKMGISNLFEWFPIVWKDRPWDGAYILDVLYFKIKQTRDYIVRKDRIEDVKEVNKYCTIAMKLIESVRKDTYAMEYMDYFESKLHWNPTGETMKNQKGKKENLYKIEWEEISSCPDPYFQKYKRIYNLIKKKINVEESERKTDEKYIAMRMSWLNHERATQLLFKILAEHCEAWWD